MTATPLSDGRKSFLHGLFTTAIEGGINYWARVGDYHWAFPDQSSDFDGFSAVLESTENDWGVDRVFQSMIPDPLAAGVVVLNAGYLAPLADDQRLRLDLAVVDRGAQLFVRYCRGEIDSNGHDVEECQRVDLPDGHYWRQFVVAEATHGAEGDYDAAVADNVVQFGLFGEVVYS